ncbi:prepilin peptidase, partial [Acidithiobacillus ferrooxidans]|nr:prepilin peptidase [Acidithiobacillus ferrooxidans]
MTQTLLGAAYVLTTLLGLLVGSFLNVVVHRVPRRESIIHPASHCPHCGHVLRPWENIPVLSW